jgi:hypothetical protein
VRPAQAGGYGHADDDDEEIILTSADGSGGANEGWGTSQALKFGKEARQGRYQRPEHGEPALAPLLGPANRCLVPLTSFSEPTRLTDGRSVPVWFAFDESRPPTFFAGIWTGWTCMRKVAKGDVTCDLFAFLTTEPNAEVGEFHPKAMPVILTDEDEREPGCGHHGPNPQCCSDRCPTVH